MAENSADDVRQAVRSTYGAIAGTDGSQGCCGSDSSCCGGAPTASGSVQLGYSAQELEALPAGADMNLGCGNPQVIAALQPGETVLDLGSGGGIDCFLAAKRVGPSGRVIGVDMTGEMIAKARANAAEGGYDNVEFRLGEIEHLPVADSSVDVIVSNCVINLSPDKRAVIGETFRVLAPGGRLAISDILATRPMPAELLQDMALMCGCISGAAGVEEIKLLLEEAGFEDIRADLHEGSREFIRQWAPGKGVEDYVVSASIQAVKPR